MVFAPISLNMLGFKINALDHGAVVNLGPSQQNDLFVSYKRSQGIGEQNGDLSPTLLTVSWVSDMDVIDSPTVKNSVL
ncbi:hypothetical protein [Neobacillus dielmonensis]|uniref:hypothetical protein n=1 Tax=Neobacillus dielmonensis TaxID=1347369 RepID=UPI0005AA534F|nr:hypothetical protein [Neobacillus dielmonensis]